MRSFNLKGEWLVPHAYNDEDAPGRTIYPVPLRIHPFDLAQDRNAGWVQRNWAQSEFVQRRECDGEDDQLRAAREWLAHVENGRIGTGCQTRTDEVP
jgi:hypothetical protein